MNVTFRAGEGNGTIAGHRPWPDVMGLAASIGCAIHCAAMPIAIGYLPAMQLDWLITAGFHRAMAVICSLIAIFAFVPGWRKHKWSLPAVLGLTGLVILAVHAFGGDDCCERGQSCQQMCEVCDCPDQKVALERTLLHETTEAGRQTSLSTGFGFEKGSAFPATPLGGVFLICAHLLNHRLSCRCCRRAPNG